MCFDNIVKLSAETKNMTTVLYFPIPELRDDCLRNFGTKSGYWISYGNWIGCVGSKSLIFFKEVSEDLTGYPYVDLAYFHIACEAYDVQDRRAALSPVVSMLFKTPTIRDLKVVGYLK